MTIRAIVGIAITVVLVAFAAKRGWFLFSLARSGQPAVGRTSDVPKRIEAEATEVFGQKKLLAWTIPGLAHVFAFWGFLVLGLTIIEAYGALFAKHDSLTGIQLRDVALIPRLAHPCAEIFKRSE